MSKLGSQLQKLNIDVPSFMVSMAKLGATQRPVEFRSDPETIRRFLEATRRILGES